MGWLRWRWVLPAVLALALLGGVDGAAVPAAAEVGRPPLQLAVSCEGVGQVLLELPHGIRVDGSIRVAGAGPVAVSDFGHLDAVDQRTGQAVRVGGGSGAGAPCDGVPFAGLSWAQVSPAGATVPLGVRPGDLLVGRLLLQVTVAAPPSPQAAVPAQPGVPAPLRFPYEPRLANYLAGRPGSCTVAVRVGGVDTPFLFTQQSGVNVTASIVKVDIMATLFWQAQTAGRALTSAERTDLALMIEQSDNNAATRLWNHVGQGPAVASFNRQVPMPATTMGPGGFWGLTTTTAPDQAALMARLAAPNTLLSEPYRQYGLSLLHQVIAAQAWGVSTGPPAGTVALKNGWLPRTDGWHVNSIGAVAATGASYVVVVLTSDSSSSATMAQQIATIDGVSRIVWTGQSGQPALPAPGFIDHLLRQGSPDAPQVRVLQTRLTQFGYDVHGVDGLFGPATDSAVRSYQRDPAQHLTPDGVVGPATGTALGIWR